MHHGCASAVVFVVVDIVLGGGVGGRSSSTITRRRQGQVSRQRQVGWRTHNGRGQATEAKAEAVQEQTTINQKVAAKMFKILLGLGLYNILNITKRLCDNQPNERPERCVMRGNGTMRGGGTSKLEAAAGGAPGAAVAGAEAAAEEASAAVI